MEIRSVTGFRERPATLVRGAIFLGLSALAVGFAGGGLSIVLGINAVLATILCTVFAADPVAGERILRGGVGAMALALILGLLIGTAAEIRALSRRARITLVVVTLLTLVSRAAFFHPQAFYPDYRVHALVQQTMDRLGLGGFLDHLFEIQYARSLGLQQIEGRWYPFPYPPGSYVITNGVSDLLRMDALDSSIVTAVVAASLIPLLTAAMGMALGLGEFASVAGALFVALQPLLVRRMALGYFPGLIGQLGDALSMVLLVKVLHSSSSATRPAGVLAGALLGAFLVYTQSIVNFGLFVATLLLLELGRRSLPTATTLRIAFAAALALSISMGVFYLRYLPVLENVTAHRPQPESRVLDRLEQIRRTTPDADVPEVEDLNDFYAGSTINPGRGLARLGSRLWRFNGPFSLAIGVGFWLLLRAANRRTQNMVLAWGAVAVWISLLSAGLPSPNSFQHLKDLEFVAPLLALAMGILAKRLWDYRPALALALGGSWLIFAAREFTTEFSGRLLPMSGL